MTAANIYLNDISQYVKTNNIKPVTSAFAMLPSTTQPHPDGLFSETIFTPVGSPSRINQEGYIYLKTNVLHPDIYDDIGKLNRLYHDIMSSRSSAYFDTIDKDFISTEKIKSPGPHLVAGSGYGFFMKYFPQLVFKKNNSSQRNDRIDVINKYRSIVRTNKWLVLPAGLRDIRIKGTEVEIEEVNKHYTKLLMYTEALPDKFNEDDFMWDSVRYGIQKQLSILNHYFFDILSGKTGFVQAKTTARSVTYSTRNVLIGTKVSAHSSKGHKHRVNEIRIPLLQAAKGYTPLVVHHMNSIFLNTVLDTDTSSTLYAITPDTLQLTKITLSETEIKKNFSKQSVEDRIENYRVPELRHLPFAIQTTTGKHPHKYYYLFLVYDDGKHLCIFRNQDEFTAVFKEQTGKLPDRSKIRPLTNVEALYISTYHASYGKYAELTRYPVLGLGGTHGNKTVVTTTDPARQVTLINILNPQDPVVLTYEEYPMIGADIQHIGGVAVHPVLLPGPTSLGADMDGDTISVLPIWTTDANKQIEDKNKTRTILLNSNGKLNLPIKCDVTEAMLHCLSIVE